MNRATVNKVIDDFNDLRLGDKEYAVEIIEKQLIEAKRESIAKRAEESVNNFKKGLVSKGTVRDLYEDLESD